jgi:DNA-binding transcriptional ArsR family regulator
MSVKMSETRDVRELERMMKAFANRRRIAIVKYLKVAKEATVGEVAENIRLSFKATSKHLAILAAAGVVERDQRGLQMFYKISGDLAPAARHILSIL